MNTHVQMHDICHVFSLISSKEFDIKVSPVKPVVKESAMLAVDQFFSQSHRLRNGFVDTSPSCLDDSAAAAHITPVEGEQPFPADMTDDDIHGLVVSKKVQTPAELSRLKSLRPDISQYQEPEDDPVINEFVEPVNE